MQYTQEGRRPSTTKSNAEGDELVMQDSLSMCGGGAGVGGQGIEESMLRKFGKDLLSSHENGAVDETATVATPGSSECKRAEEIRESAVDVCNSTAGNHQGGEKISQGGSEGGINTIGVLASQPSAPALAKWGDSEKNKCEEDHSAKENGPEDVSNTFVGYDFNTVQKVGSSTISAGGSLPSLLALKSSAVSEGGR